MSSVINFTTSGCVLSLSILNPGLGYSNGTNIPTFVVSENDITNTNQIISQNKFTKSQGPFKIDNLSVDITVDSNGSIITAVPSILNRGLFYEPGLIVSVRSNNNIQEECLLKVLYVS